MDNDKASAGETHCNASLQQCHFAFWNVVVRSVLSSLRAFELRGRTPSDLLEDRIESRLGIKTRLEADAYYREVAVLIAKE